jgi:hypothetical protein
LELLAWITEERPKSMTVIKRAGPLIRSELSHRLSSRSDAFFYDTSTTSISPDRYAGILSASKFCFAPRGDTMSCKHLYNAIAVGCVPIVISDSWKLPFANIIPWPQMIIRWNESSVYNATKFNDQLDQLNSMNNATYLALKKVLLQWRNALMFEPVEFGKLIKTYIGG